jgi:hypothetical protein
MIEVFAAGNRWTWRMICAAGRTLAYTAETWATDFEAFTAAKHYRATIWSFAAKVDERQGANF